MGAGLRSEPRPCGSGADLPPRSLTRAGVLVGLGGTHLQRMLLQWIREESVTGAVDTAAGRIEGFSALCDGGEPALQACGRSRLQGGEL